MTESKRDGGEVRYRVVIRAKYDNGEFGSWRTYKRDLSFTEAVMLYTDLVSGEYNCKIEVDE